MNEYQKYNEDLIILVRFSQIHILGQGILYRPDISTDEVILVARSSKDLGMSHQHQLET